MRTTYMTASSLAVYQGKRKVLHDLHFQLDSGETICLLGDLESGRNDFYAFLLGHVGRHEGNLRTAVGITQDSILEIPEFEAVAGSGLSSLSLIDFLFLVRPRPLPSFIWDSRRNTERVLSLFDEVGLENKPSDTISDLSAAGFMRLCLAKALDMDARIVLSRPDLAALPPNDRKDLFSLLETLKGKGMTFVVNLDSFSSAILPEAVYWLFNGGTITRKGTEPMLLRRDKEENSRSVVAEEAGKEVLRLGQAVLHEGEILLLARASLGLQQALLGHLESEGRKDMVLVDRLGEERLFPELSLEDNLLMASYHKICGWSGLLPSRSVYNVVLGEWADGESVMGKSVRELTPAEQVSLQLEGIRIHNAKVLVFLEPFLHLDDSLRAKLISFFRLEQERGKGILVISAADYEDSWYSRKVRLGEGGYL